MDKQTKAEVEAVIKALTFCEKEGRKCKKCKDRGECKLFIRSSIAVCLQLLLGKKNIADSMHV